MVKKKVKNPEEVPKNQAPVKVGEILIITPSGMGHTDPFYKHSGFMLFIKKCPVESQKALMKVKVTATKDKYGFLEFLEEC